MFITYVFKLGFNFCCCYSTDMFIKYVVELGYFLSLMNFFLNVIIKINE